MYVCLRIQYMELTHLHDYKLTSNSAKRKRGNIEIAMEKTLL